MIFDDLFYPGNPKKREEIYRLRADIIVNFTNYKNNWNELADIFNEALSNLPAKHVLSDVRVKSLVLSIEKDTVEDVHKEIMAAATDMQIHFNKVIEDIGIDKLLPLDWKEGIKISDIKTSTMLEISKALFSVAGSVAAMILMKYIITGSIVAASIISVIGTATAALGVMAGGIVLGLVLGGAVFIITDIIASAITGAIERKELKESLDLLRDLKDKTAVIDEAQRKLGGIIQTIKDGVYDIGDDRLIRFNKKKERYEIVDLNTGAVVEFLPMAA